MPLSATALSSSNELDFLLADVAEQLQLTQTQHDEADAHYRACTQWLEAPESIFAVLSPRLFPQGSMAILTTVRPKERAEFDLDFVLKIKPVTWSAAELFDALYDRLANHGRYEPPMLEAMNRCVRLNYTGEFHLDIIPGIEAPGGHGEVLLVPDRERRAFVRSNPEGFIRWFKQREALEWTNERRARILAKAQPLPKPEPVHQKSTLAVAVQLIKRRRDLVGDEDLEAPSIMLTALAGQFYSGSPSVAGAIGEIMSGIAEQLKRAAPRMITVRNPALIEEDFSERIDTAAKYRSLRGFVERFASEMDDLTDSSTGVADGKLAAMFGEEQLKKSLVALADRHRSKRDAGTLTHTGGRLAILGPLTGGAQIARHTYHGDG